MNCDGLYSTVPGKYKAFIRGSNAETRTPRHDLLYSVSNAAVAGILDGPVALELDSFVGY